MAEIFVSYASPDRDVAFRIVGFLEEQGISCWVAPRDKNFARFTIVDDSTMKLVRADGEAQDGPIRVRCPAVK